MSHRYSGRKSGIQETAQLARAARVLELAERLRLDLADTLAGHGELLADLLQSVVGVHADAEAHAQHARLARRQRGPDRGRARAQGSGRAEGRERGWKEVESWGVAG